jgi:hypothetical protein
MSLGIIGSAVTFDIKENFITFTWLFFKQGKQTDDEIVVPDKSPSTVATSSASHNMVRFFSSHFPLTSPIFYNMILLIINVYDTDVRLLRKTKKKDLYQENPKQFLREY